MADLPNISYIDGSIRVTVKLNMLNKRTVEAQQWLGDRVLEDCRARMPIQTGSLQQRSHTEDGGKSVIFPGPYARYLYGGKVMVDALSGSGPRKIPTGPGEYILRFRKGAKLVATDRPLKYSNPHAVPQWFEHAKQQNKQFWIAGAKEKLGGK